MLRVAQISFFLDPQRDAEQILRDWSALVDTAEMAAQAGCSVTVIQACRQTETITRNAVTYRFLSPEPGEASIVGSAAFAEVLAELQADVFHVQGLGFPGDVLALAKLEPATPILLQDHALTLPRPWRRSAIRRGCSVAAAIAFCSLEQTQPFIRARMFNPRTVLAEIPECSSRFTPGDRQQERAATGLHGDPALLWVGHLDSNKDPLTVLRGVAAAAPQLPDLHLWCCFGKGPLRARMQAQIEADSRLSGRVHLLGSVPHPQIEQLMRAADLFVLGSHREGSGFALIEALACGLPPVVTDIPSFRALTGRGKVGALWPCGDADGLCEALLSVAKSPPVELRAAVRSHFDSEISFQAVGRKLLAAYEHCARLRSAGARPVPSGLECV